MAKEKYTLYEVEDISSIRELLEKAKNAAGDKLAFRYRVGANDVADVTYNEFYERTQALGTALASRGLTSTHIACIGENSYDWLTCYLTVLQSEGVFVPVDKELPDSDIKNILINSDSTVMFCSGKYEARLRAMADELPDIKYFISFTLKEDDGKFLSFEKLIEEGRELYKNGSDIFTSQKRDEYALALLVYTSGTTGLAKGVMLSEHNLVSSVKYGLQISTIYTTSLSVLPYHHTYEAVPGILVALHKRCTICINDNLSAVLKNLTVFKPDYIYLVPAFAEVFYKRIWENAEKSGKADTLRKGIKISRVLMKLGIDMRRKIFATVHEAFGGNLREIVCGGAPIRPEIGQFFNDIGITLLNGYGITECSPLVSVNPIMFNDPNTVGIPLKCIEVKIDNPDEEGNGEIMVKGDIVMMGYYKMPEQTAEALSEDGWFRTGDYGTLTEHGQLVITGRKKNLIVLTNGKNVYPEEIENYIAGIPYVKEVVVYSIKDEEGHETGLCAEVFLNKDYIEEKGITDVATTVKADIKAACAELPTYKQIAKVVVRDVEFEKTTTNKIKRHAIKKD
ncbi:MAG: AMP-binding protein [Clostridia bacterium]|nr:AMP-binding protein [Clostridia bacterium]